MTTTRCLILPKSASTHTLASLLAPAVDLLQRDQVVAIPTETVYGLAANALSPSAVDAIYAAKGRPRDNPLIVHCSSMDMVAKYFLPRGKDALSSFPTCYRGLVQRYWPGPLTIILPLQQHVLPDQVTCGLPTVAVRVPDDVVTRTLIEACGFPLAAPSANTSTRPSPTCAAHVLEDLDGKIPMVIDGGQVGGDGMCAVGIESTVVDGLSDDKVILRPGAVTLEELQQFEGWERVKLWKPQNTVPATQPVVDGWQPVAPGMKYTHYAPRTPVTLLLSKHPDHSIDIDRVLQHVEPHQTVALLGLNLHEHEYQGSSASSSKLVTHSLGSSPSDMAHNLFAQLRKLDTTVDGIWIMGIDEQGIGSAVMNRVRKAATTVVHLD